MRRYTELMKIRTGVAAIVLSALLLTVQGALLAPMASAETVDTTAQRVGLKIEYPVSEGPVNVAWESPGRGWFTSPDKDLIGSIIRNSNADDELISVSILYIALANGSRPYDIVYDNNTVWFTEYGANQLGRIDIGGGTLVIAGPTKEYPLPVAGSGPAGLAVAPDGSVWIAEANRPVLARFDPVSETFTEYSYATLLPSGSTVSTNNALPEVAIGDGDTIWLTVPGADMVVAYEISRVRFFRISLSSPGFPVREPSSILIDPDGLPWVTAYDNSLVGRYAPGTLALWRWFKTPTADSGPRGLSIQDNGGEWDIWFSEEKAGKLGRLTVLRNDIRVVGLVAFAQAPESRPSGTAIGADDTIWFAESGRRTVAELRPPYAYVLRMPLLYGVEQQP